MFYNFCRFLIRFALPIFLKRFVTVGKKNVPATGPVLLASNHAGSFFDAIVVGSILKKHINTLTRGDVFKNPKAEFWLRQINLIPVFRGSEGRDNLKKNDNTLEESFSIFKKDGIVMIFSEGLCVHEWKLRPLGKGTARMAYQAWYGPEAFPDLKVVPTGLTYEHFRGANKRVVIKFGAPILPQDITTDAADYEKWLREFNAILKDKMEATILQIPDEVPAPEKKKIVKEFLDSECPQYPGNAVFNLIGKIGRLIHRPIYQFMSKKVAIKTGRSVFYDSVLFGLLLFLYPVLVLIVSLIVGCFAGLAGALATFVALPLLALIGNRYR